VTSSRRDLAIDFKGPAASNISELLPRRAGGRFTPPPRAGSTAVPRLFSFLCLAFPEREARLTRASNASHREVRYRGRRSRHVRPWLHRSLDRSQYYTLSTSTSTSSIDRWALLLGDRWFTKVNRVTIQ
jgi:hypothetical protein